MNTKWAAIPGSAVRNLGMFVACDTVLVALLDEPGVWSADPTLVDFMAVPGPAGLAGSDLMEQPACPEDAADPSLVALTHEPGALPT